MNLNKIIKILDDANIQFSEISTSESKLDDTFLKLLKT